MNWYLFILGSSVGKKMLMAVTGLGMTGFLAVHLLGNVMAFAGAEAFNGYAAKLHSLQPYLTVFNIGLATLGLVHIVVGIILFFENLKARPTRYRVYQNPGGRTFGSNTMPYTGVLILMFVIFHLLKFTFVDKSVTPISQPASHPEFLHPAVAWLSSLVMTNDECRMSNCGSRFALLYKIKIDRSTLSLDPEALEGRLSTGEIPKFVIRQSSIFTRHLITLLSTDKSAESQTRIQTRASPPDPVS